jgi:hypothetical protein
VTLSTFATRWYRCHQNDNAGADTEAIPEKEYADPAKFDSADVHVKVMSDAVIECLCAALQLSSAAELSAHPIVILGLGLSAAGCVCSNHIVGIPPAFSGVPKEVAEPVLKRLDQAILEGVQRDTPSTCTIGDGIPTVIVNDGDAMALCGAEVPTLFLSCGTGLAGGFVDKGELCSGVLELGKIVVAIRVGEEGFVPKHDILDVEGVAQGLACTQRSVFNLLRQQTDTIVTDKAEQRSTLIAMQKSFDDNAAFNTDIFEELGDWLAQFVVEFQAYLDVVVEQVQAGGKATDGKSGTVALKRANARLPKVEVARAADAEFGQAVAAGAAVLPSATPSPQSQSKRQRVVDSRVTRGK